MKLIKLICNRLQISPIFLSLPSKAANSSSSSPSASLVPLLSSSSPASSSKTAKINAPKKSSKPTMREIGSNLTPSSHPSHRYAKKKTKHPASSHPPQPSPAHSSPHYPRSIARASRSQMTAAPRSPHLVVLPPESHLRDPTHYHLHHETPHSEPHYLQHIPDRLAARSLSPWFCLPSNYNLSTPTSQIILHALLKPHCAPIPFSQTWSALHH